MLCSEVRKFKLVCVHRVWYDLPLHTHTITAVNACVHYVLYEYV